MSIQIQTKICYKIYPINQIIKTQHLNQMMQPKRSKGIIRNKTQTLMLNKQAKRKKNSRFTKQNLSGLSSLQYSINNSNAGTPTMLRNPLTLELEKMPTMSTLPPEWVEKYEECLGLIDSIDQLKKQILTEQSRRLSLIKQSQQKQSQQKIYTLTTLTTKKIKTCQALLNQIRKQQPSQSQSQKRTKNNVCMSLAVIIQQKTRELRNQQRAFIEQRQNIQKSTKVSFLELAAERACEGFEDDWGDQQQIQLQLKVNKQRNEQILKIIQSVHQLNQLYKQLNSLVILQGSLLDRIDYNIQQSVMHVKKADQTLGRVDERQKKSKCSCIVIVIMLLTVVILGIILIVKWSK